MYECITPYLTYVVGGLAENNIYDQLPAEGKACFKFIGNETQPSPGSIHPAPGELFDPFRINLLDDNGERPLPTDFKTHTSC